MVDLESCVTSSRPGSNPVTRTACRVRWRCRSAADALRQVVRHLGEVEELAREHAEAVAGWETDRVDVVVEGRAFAKLAADERFARNREGDLARAGVQPEGTERVRVSGRDATLVV